MSEFNDALDKGIEIFDDLRNYDYQSKLMYGVDDVLFHMQEILRQLRYLSPHDNELDYNKPGLAIDKIKQHADFIQSYSQEIQARDLE